MQGESVYTLAGSVPMSFESISHYCILLNAEKYFQKIFICPFKKYFDSIPFLVFPCSFRVKYGINFTCPKNAAFLSP